MEKRKSVGRGKKNRLVGAVLAGVCFAVGVARILTFLNARGYISEWQPFESVHIHHFVYGIITLAVAGYLALLLDGPITKRILAFVYGIGIGLVFDEIGMWLKLREVHPDPLQNTGIIAVTIVFFVLLAVGALRALFFARKYDSSTQEASTKPPQEKNPPGN